MKHSFYPPLGFALVASLLLSSCEKKEALIAPAEQPPVSTTDSAILRADFAQALAKALQEKPVREFLKQEALKTYDGDYDVLYALVKDKPLANGKTLEQSLAQYTSSAAYDCTQWAKQEPLMTIFIPSLKDFSPDTWDVASQIPAVAIDNSHQGKTDKFAAFSATSAPYEVSAKIAPTTPMVVVKENERIVAKSKFANAAAKAPGFAEQKSVKVIAEDESHSFYFVGDYQPKMPGKTSARNAAYATLPATLMNFQNYYTQIAQRDWIYYHILPSSWGTEYDRGAFAPMYSEFVRGFKLASPSVLQGVTDNWAEGLLEFHITVAFLYRDGTVNTDLKVFYCAPGDLMDGDGTMLEYEPNTELMPWDMQRYGDEWKLSLLEYDPGGSVSQTVSAQTNFGYNFEANATIFKIGVKFGTTGSFQKSNSTTVVVTAADDLLGDVRFLYDDPIITGPAPSNDGTAHYMTKSITTGAVTISVEPEQTYADNRPPYDI